MNLEQQFASMKTGKMYNDLTNELIEARQEAVLLTNKYNQSFGQPADVRKSILSEIYEE